MPQVFTSWKASVPIIERGTCPVIATSGTESSFASAIAVIRFVAPGPEVAKQTAALPVERAMPWAINPAPCSCRASICRIGLAYRALYSGRFAPPGIPAIMVTPRISSILMSISAPFIFIAVSPFAIK